MRIDIYFKFRIYDPTQKHNRFCYSTGNYNIAKIFSLAERYDLDIMQWTGRNCNGEDIYGGDIVSINGQGKHIVKYSNPHAWFFLEQIGTGHRCTLGSSIGDLKVIGNIYENPELLEGKS